MIKKEILEIPCVPARPGTVDKFAPQYQSDCFFRKLLRSFLILIIFCKYKLKNFKSKLLVIYILIQSDFKHYIYLEE